MDSDTGSDTGSGITRRAALKTGAAALAAGLATTRAYAANERVRVGVVGTGNRGGQLLNILVEQANCEVTALCDVDTAHREAWGAKIPAARLYNDYRDMYDAGGFDAVVIATPDHWHALQTIHACQAGYDIYCEKPLSMTIVEGRAIADWARHTDRIVSVGLQRRSSPMFAELRERVQAGEFGVITNSRAYRLSNMWPAGLGKGVDSEPPEGLDWDLWLGPRAERPFRDTIHPYNFRWWHLYSSQMANWGVHYFDLMRWIIGEEAPASVSAHGGVYAVDDDRTIPDTMHAIFEFERGGLMHFGQYEASGRPMLPPGREFELRGTKAQIVAGRRGFEAIPERGGQHQDPAPRMEAVTVEVDEPDNTLLHVQDFLDCVVTRRKPNCDAEEGHRSTSFALLANMALAAEARLKWDPDAERCISPEEANALLHYEYRAPWVLPKVSG